MRAYLFRSALLLLGFVLLSGCDKARCAVPPTPAAAFRMQLTADRGVLPPGTVLKVTYGGDQSESYTVGGPYDRNVDVCCRPALPDPNGKLPSVPCSPPDAAPTSPDGGPVQALDCELWTNGPAALAITAPGFPELDTVLQAKQRADHCGVETLDERVVLSHTDSGM